MCHRTSYSKTHFFFIGMGAPKQKTINNIAMIPMAWKLLPLEWLRKEEEINKNEGAAESETFYSVS